MAFLGKISAVVTANTTDFTKKIEGTKQELMGLKRQLSGYQLNINTKSIDGTLTKLQKFNRTLQEAANLTPFERLANGFPDLKRLADQFKAFEDVGKPLTKVKDQIEGLSNSVQARLYPELEKAQKGFQRLYNEIGAGTTTFDKSKNRIDGLLASLTRLSRVSAAASDIGQLTSRLNANNAGASFFQPATRDALQRSLDLRSQAEKLPARFRGGVFADLAVEAEANAQKIEDQAARVAAAVLKAQRDGRFARSPRGLEAIAKEQEQLDNLTRQQEVINNQLSREIRSAQIREIISPENDTLVDRLREKFQRLAGDLRAINGSRFDGVIGSVGTLVDQLNRGEVSAKRVSAALEGLSKVRAASQAVAGATEAADKALRSQRERDSRTIQQAASFQRQQIRQTAANRFRRLNEVVIQSDDRIVGLETQRRELIDLQRSGRLGDDNAISQVDSKIASERARRDRAAELAARLSQSRRERLTGITVGEAISLERVAFADVAERTKELSEKKEVRSDPRLARQAEEARQRSLALAGQLNTIGSLIDAGKVDEARAALKSFVQQSDAQIASLNKLEKAIASVSTAQERLNKFFRESGGLSTKLGETFERNAGDIKLLRNVIGNFEQRAERAGGSDRAQQAIKRAEAENERLIRLEGKILGSERRRTPNGLTQQQFEEQRSRRLEFVRQRALRERDNLVEEVAAGSQAGGARGQSVAQLQATLDSNAKNRGSFGARGAAVVQLAAQQGLFAIDDLISATGGLEYKLRAVGNNITQLGLLLGQSGVIPGLSATTGLAIGLATVIGGQVVSAVLRWATGAKEVDQRLKALNRSLEIQKTLAQQVAQSFSSIASGIANAGFDEAARSANELTESIKKLSQQQRDVQGKGIADVTDRSISNRQQQEDIRQRLEAESRPGVRVALQRRLSALQGQEASRVDALGRLAAPAPDEIRKSLADVANGLRRSQEQINQEFDLLPKPTALTRSAFEADLLSRTLPVGRQDQLEALNALADRLSATARERTIFGTPTAPAEEAGKALEQIQKQILRLEATGQLAQFLELAADASRYLAESQTLAARAIEAGVPGAIEFQDRLRVLAKQIADAENTISIAQQDERLTPAQRNRIIGEQNEIINRSAGERSQLFRQLSRLDSGITVDGRSLFSDTASRALENLGAAGLGSGSAARRIRELEATRQQAQSVLRAVRPDNAAEREAASRVLRATNQEIQRIEAASIALRTFSETISRASSEVESNFQSAQQRSDAARREQLSFDSPRTRAERDIAQRDADAARTLRDNVDQAIADQSARLERQALDGVGPLVDVADRIRRAQAELESGAATPDRRAELRQQILADRSQIQQAAIGTQQVRDAIDASTLFEERAQAARGGRELTMTAADRAAEEVSQQIAKIGAALGRQDINQQDASAAASRLVEEQSRAAAPAIFSLADSVANAILQGPSRASLQATDVSTVEGQRELNRLLRGDDSARDANLVELEKQSQLLEKIEVAAKATADKMGMVLNWQ